MASFIAFLWSIVVGARRFAPSEWSRADRVLRALLGRQCLHPMVPQVVKALPCALREHGRGAGASGRSYRRRWRCGRRVHGATLWVDEGAALRGGARAGAEPRAAVGRKLLDVPGYTFRMWVTNRSQSALELWPLAEVTLNWWSVASPKLGLPEDRLVSPRGCCAVAE